MINHLPESVKLLMKEHLLASDLAAAQKVHSHWKTKPHSKKPTLTLVRDNTVNK